MVPMLLRSGHEVVGLDSNLYERCTFAAGGDVAQVPHIRKDVRDVELADLEGLDVEKAERVLRPVEGERDAVDALVRARRP